MNLSHLIAQVLSLKPNEEFALFFYAPGWTAMIVNEMPSVSLGETAGKFMADGHTPEEAVRQLLAVLGRLPEPM